MSLFPPKIEMVKKEVVVFEYGYFEKIDTWSKEEPSVLELCLQFSNGVRTKLQFEPSVMRANRVAHQLREMALLIEENCKGDYV